MIEKLMELKRLGAYAVQIRFGQDIGIEDFSIPQDETELFVSFYPTCYTGGRRVLWKGQYKDFITFDFQNEKPLHVSNVIEPLECKYPAYYAWGAESNKDYF